MKKFALLMTLLITCSSIQAAEIMQQYDKRVSVDVYQDRPIYVHKGRYTYMFDKYGFLIGYFKKNPGGKVIVYDSQGKQRNAYKQEPGGELAIYNQFDEKIN